MFEDLKKNFPFLLQRFRKAVKGIADYQARKGCTQFLIEETARFEREVMAPLDAAWDQMSPEEKMKYPLPVRPRQRRG